MRANTRNAAGIPEAAAAENDVVRLSPTGCEVGVSSYGQNVTYRGGLAVDDGRLTLPDIKTDNAGLALLLPLNDPARAIADRPSRSGAPSSASFRGVRWRSPGF